MKGVYKLLDEQQFQLLLLNKSTFDALIPFAYLIFETFNLKEEVKVINWKKYGSYMKKLSIVYELILEEVNDLCGNVSRYVLSRYTLDVIPLKYFSMKQLKFLNKFFINYASVRCWNERGEAKYILKNKVSGLSF